MKRVLVPIADGFEEIEAITIVDILRRAGLRVFFSSLKQGEVRGSRRIRVIPDLFMNEAVYQEWDAIIVPGGKQSVDSLRKDPRLMNLIRKLNEQGKLIGGICAAPYALRDAGVFGDKKMTTYPTFEDEFKDCQFVNEPVVYDQNVVTSQSPGTALEFSLKLVEILVSKEMSDRLRDLSNIVS